MPTRFQEKVFVDGGSEFRRSKVVLEDVDADFFDLEQVGNVYNLASEMTMDMTDKTTVYLSIFKWEDERHGRSCSRRNSRRSRLATMSFWCCIRMDIA